MKPFAPVTSAFKVSPARYPLSRQTPHVFGEVAQHTGKMPGHVTKIPPACPLRFMYHGYAGMKHHAPTNPPEPSANVYIFIVEAKVFVETAELLEYALRK